MKSRTRKITTADVEAAFARFVRAVQGVGIDQAGLPDGEKACRLRMTHGKPSVGQPWALFAVDAEGRRTPCDFGEMIFGDTKAEAYFSLLNMARVLETVSWQRKYYTLTTATG